MAEGEGEARKSGAEIAAGEQKKSDAGADPAPAESRKSAEAEGPAPAESRKSAEAGDGPAPAPAESRKSTEGAARRESRKSAAGEGGEGPAPAESRGSAAAAGGGGTSDEAPSIAPRRSAGSQGGGEAKRRSSQAVARRASDSGEAYSSDDPGRRGSGVERRRSVGQRYSSDDPDKRYSSDDRGDSGLDSDQKASRRTSKGSPSVGATPTDQALSGSRRPSQLEGRSVTSGGSKKTLPPDGRKSSTPQLPEGHDRKSLSFLKEEGTDSMPLDTFCQDQIRIPPQLPQILKQFTKAAIRTQPRDLEVWGTAYFRAMADGLPPPVKEFLEYPVMESKDGLTVGLLRVLDKQLKDVKDVTVDKVRQKWLNLCLDEKAFNELIEIGHFQEGEFIEWKKILAILCTSLGTNLTDTMKVICQVLTEQKEGADPVVPYVVWWELYLFLARLDGSIPSKQLHQVNEFLVRRAHAKFCLIGPVDFLHMDCPPLY